MLILRLGATCSMQISSDMPPHKKLKTEGGEPEVVNVVTSESESGSVVFPVIAFTPEGAVDFASDWRDRCKSLSDKYSYVLKNTVLTDVKLVVGHKATVFPCHRLILALGSPVFEAMFFGELAETGDTVIIPDVHPDGFQQLIGFLYTGQCNLKSVDVAFKTYFAADKYCVVELKHRCESHLRVCNVDPSNVWQFFENSLFLNSAALKERCLEVLRHQLKSSLEQTNFLDINYNTIKSLLTLDDLNASEEKLLKNVVEWAEYQSKMAGADSFEDTLKPLLSNIRFGDLTAKEFVHLRHQTRLREVLSEEDSLAILEHLIHPIMAQLPDWCCTKKRRYSPPISERVQHPVRSTSKIRKRKHKSFDSSFKKEFHSSSFSYSSSSSVTQTSSNSSSSSSDTSD